MGAIDTRVLLNWDNDGNFPVLLPTDISGCILWLAAHRITGLNDGDAVTTWSDLSGSGNDATQATASLKPIYRTSIINGRAVVRFDGVNDVLSMGTALNFERTDTFTIFVVAKPTSTASNDGLIAKRGAAAAYTGWTFLKTSNNTLGFQLINNFSGGNYLQSLTGGPTNITGSFRILGMTYAGTSLISGVLLYINGAAETFTADLDSLSASILTAAPSNIGNINNGGNALTGDVAEIIVFNSVLSAANRQRVESYLAGIYDIRNTAAVHTYEDVTQYVSALSPIVLSRGRDGVRAISPLRASTLECELNNNDGWFSYANAASPISPNVQAGRGIRLAAIANNTGYNFFTGQIQRPREVRGRITNRVAILAYDRLGRLAGTRISTARSAAIRTDQALTVIADAVSWPAANRAFDTGKTTIADFVCDNEDPVEVMKKIQYAEGPGAAIFVRGDDFLVFHNREHTLTQSESTSVQATFRDTGAEPLLRGDWLDYGPREKDIFNAVELPVDVRSAKALGNVWSTTVAITIAGNETKDIPVKPTDWFTAAVAPVENTDFTVSAGSVSSVTLSRTSGASTVIRITAGASGATVQNLAMRAQSVSVDRTYLIAHQVSVTTSQDKYGVRAWKEALLRDVDYDTMQSIANAIAGVYQTDRPMISFELDDANVTRAVQIATLDVNKRIAVIDTGAGGTAVNANFFCGSFKHVIDGLKKIHKVMIGAEQVIAATQYGIWDTGLWDTALWGI